MRFPVVLLKEAEAYIIHSHFFAKVGISSLQGLICLTLSQNHAQSLLNPAFHVSN